MKCYSNKDACINPQVNNNSNNNNHLKKTYGIFSGSPNPYGVGIVYLIVTCLTMFGGSAASADTDSPQEINVQNAKIQNTAELPATKRQDIIYKILLAEIAASRNDSATALQNYTQASKITQDPMVAEQSTQLAINLQAPLEASQSAELWAKTAPDNLQAQLIAMTLTIGHSADKALPYLTRAIDLNPAEIDQYILEIQARLSEKSVHNLNEALIKLVSLKPENAYVLLTAAQSSSQLGQIKEGNQLVDSALKYRPNLTHAIQLKARLIRYEAKNDDSALKFLAKKVEAFPENNELRLFFANALLDNGDNIDAKAHLNQIKNNKELGGQALILLGQIALKENKFIEAMDALKAALEYPQSRDSAQFLLGDAEERQGHIKEALGWYTNIGAGNFQTPAFLHAVSILKKQKNYKEAIYLLHNASPNTVEEQKQLILAEIDLLNTSKSSEEAMQLANDILSKLPADADVLYIHAITASQQKKWDVAEADLKKILQQNPNNANALNALGHTLSFDKHRLDEALNYLNQALALAPNNPYFMDSLGWTYYRLGDHQKAIHYLTKANTLIDDGEIAAHLGEVLWSDNKKDDAKAVWAKAYQSNKDNLVLQETIKRYKVNIKNQK